MNRDEAKKLLKTQKTSVNANKYCLDAVEQFNKEYRAFIDSAKTERRAVEYAVSAAKARGFRELSAGEKLTAGDRVYRVTKNKSVCLAVIGKDGMSDGGRIIASHIDSPRLDLKPVPMYESGGLSYFKTHYYGGIKKYQWTALPLELQGVVYRGDGTRVDINIGADADDPVFYISDLMPHIGKDQMSKGASEFIPGESLNIINGSVPFDDEGDVKLNILSILNEKYGIVENDLSTAELTAVPAVDSREVGFDRSMIAAYGHDDRICAFPSLKALFECDIPQKTAIVMLADKEEIG